MDSFNSYHLAQQALANLKSSIYILLEKNVEGMSNAEIGRSLGIYQGHIGHEGHIPRTLLGLMQQEGVVEQNADNKHWYLVR